MSEQAAATAELPSNGNAETPALSGRKYGGEPSNRRVKELLERLFGHSLDKQIQGLCAIHKGATETIHNASDAKLKAAYQRGRSDLLAEMDFSERLAAIREKYADFDHAWSNVRPLVPRSVLTDMADNPEGLEAAYALAKLPELCQELSEMEPSKARERFSFFVRDLLALKGAR